MAKADARPHRRDVHWAAVLNEALNENGRSLELRESLTKHYNGTLPSGGTSLCAYSPSHIMVHVSRPQHAAPANDDQRSASSPPGGALCCPAR
jgi:hypothetical protein